MEVLIVDWLSLLVRWVHVVAGIGWIGASFYFVALDLGLKKHGRLPPGVMGEEWQVHGGGFYHVQKYSVAPDDLPQHLVWFKWDAYTTFLSGTALLILVYYFSASVYLIDPSVLDLSPLTACLISAASLTLGWLGYDALCKSKLGASDTKLAIVVAAMAIAAAFLYGLVFSGRAAFLHAGALVGTIMAANVFFVIIPNQRKTVASLLARETPDATLGRKAKQRSLHNNYLTLPVIFTMISNHYPMTYADGRGWLVFAGVVIAGIFIRHYFNEYHAGRVRYLLWPAAAGGLAFAALITVMGRSDGIAAPERTVAFAEVQPIITERCTVCHGTTPSFDGFAEAPAGLVLETEADVMASADLIHAQTVASNVMPPGNLTGITDEERALLAAFLQNGDGAAGADER